MMATLSMDVQSDAVAPLPDIRVREFHGPAGSPLRRTLLVSTLTVAIVATVPTWPQDPITACSDRVRSYSSGPASWDGRPLRLTAPGGGELLYLGVEHFNSPYDTQMSMIVTAFDDFDPDRVFFEGYSLSAAANSEDSVRRYGESGLLRFLARENGIPARSMDPTAREELDFVRRWFTEEQVLLTYVLRDIERLRRTEGVVEEPELADRVNGLLRPGVPGVPSVASNVEEFAAAFRHVWGLPEAWWRPRSVWFDPTASSASTGGVFTNDVMQTSYAFRDRHMYRLLARAVLDGHRVLAIVGRTHLPMQAPALRCVVGQSD